MKYMTENTIIMMTKEELNKFVSDIVIQLTSNSTQATEQQNLQTYNRKEVCEKLDISYPTLLKLEKRGLIRGRKSGRKFFYTNEDVNTFINHTTKPLN